MIKISVYSFAVIGLLYSLNFFLPHLPEYISTHGLESNLIDFLGNAFNTIGAAVIAYIISKTQLSKEKQKNLEENKVKLKGYLRLLKSELEYNLMSIESSIETDNGHALNQLEKNIWMLVYSNLEIPQNDFEDIYRLYKRFDITKEKSDVFNSARVSEFKNHTEEVVTMIETYL